MSEPNARDANIEAVRASARLNAPDRYYASLFAPAAVRADLIALAAFTGEIDRIARHISEPAIGEIRIQWWREALAGSGSGTSSGNPVLDAFADVAKRHSLDPAMIDDFLDAHAHVLHADAPVDDAALDFELQIIDGTPFTFAAQILGIELDDEARELIHQAARAAGMARIGLELPFTLRAGRSPLPEKQSPLDADNPEDWRPRIAWLAAEAIAAMAAVRRHLAGKQRDFTTALLPLALVEPHFRALQEPRHDPTRDIVEIAPLGSLWRIARAHWTGRL